MAELGKTSFTTRRHLPLVASLATLMILTVGASADPGANGAPVERVRGFFCNSQADQIAFLEQQARGENQDMAANAVNKSVAQASCAYYLPLQAIVGEEQTIFSGGLVFKVQKFVFLPEKSEHWAGSVLGAVPASVKESDT